MVARGTRLRATGDALLIGEAAARAGVTKRTLGYYQEKGLLGGSRRGVFKTFQEADVRRVREIKRLQSLLDLNLSEIGRSSRPTMLLTHARSIAPPEPP